MLIIPIKENEPIERALKKFKKKFERTGAIKQLRARKQFTKKSVLRREEIQKAAYVQQLREQEEGR
jgi:small subunit ribosomal protein S21